MDEFDVDELIKETMERDRDLPYDNDYQAKILRALELLKGYVQCNLDQS